MGRASQILSYVVLTATAIACIVYSGGKKADPFVLATFITIAVYGILGLFRVAVNKRFCSDALDNLHEYSYNLVPFLALPCLVTSVWLKHNVVNAETAYLHAGLGALMSVLMLVQCVSQDVIDVLVAIDGVSLGAIGVLNSNANALSAAMFFQAAHFGAMRCSASSGYSITIPADDLYNYLLSAFTYFAMISVKS